jgi:hypothetical protein
VPGVADASRTTPISEDDTSRLVRLLVCLDGGLEHLAVASCYGRAAPGREHAARWTRACQQLMEADTRIAAAIATWHGRYQAWGVQGPHPTSAGVRLGCERMAVGLTAIRERLERGYQFSAESIDDVDAAVTALRAAYRLMWPAMRAAGCRPGKPPVPLDRVRWEELPGGTSADLTRLARSTSGGG